MSVKHNAMVMTHNLTNGGLFAFTYQGRAITFSGIAFTFGAAI